MTYAVTRKDLCRAFKAAKPFLSMQEGDSKTSFICRSISRGCYHVGIIDAVALAARDIISARIDNVTIDEWLEKRGVKHSHMTHTRLQAYRHTWLDMLIKEFSK